MALSAQTVHSRLQDAAKRFRLSRSARFLISGTALSLFFLVAFLIADARIHFGATGRWIGFLSMTSTLIGGLALAAYAFRPRLSEAGMARRIERSCSGSRNVLINAVQFDSTLAADSPMRSALFNEMHDPFPQVRWDEVFDLKLLKKLAAALGGVALVIVLWGLISPGHFANSAARIFMPSKNIAPLTRTKILKIDPGADIVTTHGGSVAITVQTGGETPRTAWVRYREAGSSWQKVLMEHEVGQPIFTFAWKDVRQPIDYYLIAGDAETETHHITVRPKTTVKTRTAEITLPAYTKMPKIRVQNFSVLQNVPPGSKVAVTMDFNNPLSEVTTTDEKGEPFAVEKISDSRWKLTGVVSANRSMKVRFSDTEHVAESEPLEIAVKADEPPKITILEPAEGRELLATPGSILRIRFIATDNYALGPVGLYKSTNDKQDAELVRGWLETNGEKSYNGQIEVVLKKFVAEGDDRVTFCVIAKDQNDVTGPGVTVSRPIVVTLKTADKVQKQVEDSAAKLQKSLEDVIKLQRTNLEESRAAGRMGDAQPGALSPLLTRQVQISEIARTLAAAADSVAPDIRKDLIALYNREMKDAVLALRDALGLTGKGRQASLARAITFELAIMARLQGAPEAVDKQSQAGQIADLIAGVEELLKKQRDISRETSGATEQTAPLLSKKQDALADQSVRVRKEMEKNAANASLGDADFRARLGKVAGMFGELKIYEEMLGCADKLQAKNFAGAGTTEKQIVLNLTKMIDILNQWQIAESEKGAADLKAEAEHMKNQLNKLEALQKEIVEKSREMARKDQLDATDKATQNEIRESKDLMKDVLEKMLTDAHAFPDMKPANELKSQLTEIMEEVEQTDKEDAANGKLKPDEVPVQKEDGLLQAIEKAKEVEADMEMWLPNKSDTAKWLLENFDKTEMPEIPNLPLPDAFEDIVGKMLDEQKNLDAEDSASNQAIAEMAQGWEIADGPMPGFSAQGKTGNQRPNHNEQMGRSSGGREGMSNGEMAGDTAQKIEGGDTPDVRRSNDPMQKGSVDGGDTEAHARATGGGKSGGFSDRDGMEGNAPLLKSQAQAARTAANDAKAVQQKLLADKASKTAAQASLLYMRSDGLKEVSRMMGESEQALRDGRVKDFKSLHQKIVGRLTEVKSGINTGEVRAIPSNEASRTTDKQLLGGAEGEAPSQYKDMVADYYRSLNDEKK